MFLSFNLLGLSYILTYHATLEDLILRLILKGVTSYMGYKISGLVGPGYAVDQTTYPFVVVRKYSCI